ncbi:SDR family oxidoreductase [Rhodococcus tibetensis]|uniref:SDR family oxidoreductase n=1 Tax=Rhodococcus tibetensis TaxID=2965064 RepID=A0ABT1QC60_9NOCA|nr:SDR family oxidoreductase [Rhodococcus sp. FXJ9.536]MCQ4118705.1 SDR family oxidoreductase [Rhodococcus sp. FXJ9.536]
MTTIQDRTVLVTGSNRGLGRALVTEALARGARTVYAAARDASTIADHPRVVPVTMDVTDPESIYAAAEYVGDLGVLINNAGVFLGESPLTGDLGKMRRELETNLFGPLNVTRTFAPIIAANGGGAVLNVHSVLSWLAVGGSYSVSKAAVWSATNAMRLELAEQNIQVVGLHLGYMDTDMTAGLDVPKISALEVARLAFDGMESGAREVLADDVSRTVKAALAGDLEALYPQLTAQVVA